MVSKEDPAICDNCHTYVMKWKEVECKMDMSFMTTPPKYFGWYVCPYCGHKQNTHLVVNYRAVV